MKALDHDAREPVLDSPLAAPGRAVREAARGVARQGPAMAAGQASILFRPVPFWSWNERMEPAEVARQSRLIAGAGWGGGFIHSRVGLTTPYLGEEWFAACDAAVGACGDLGLKVWLYDEDKWPSGYSGGSVPLADERFRQRALIARREGVAAPAGARPVGAARDGVQVYEWIAPLGNPWFNGTCYTDLLNEQAVRRFLDDAYEPYARRYQQHYGTLVTAQFTDEPAAIFRMGLPKGAVPFSSVLPERFRSMFGEDALEKAGLLFAEGSEAIRFRLRYFQCVNDLFEQNFTRQLGDWCRSQSIALTGHFMAEQGLYDQQLWGVKVMPNYRHQEIPGIDHLARQTEEVLTAKQCQSVVNQYGKRRMLSELYGVSGQNLSFEDRWWIAAQQIALGVNLLNPHLALYTLSGCRKRDYPPNLFYQQPWWPMNRVLADRLSRLCEQMAQGRYVAEALVIHPQESVWAQWRSDAEVADPTAENLTDHDPTAAGVKKRIVGQDRRFKQILEALLGGQIGFDLGDETILSDDAEVVRDGADALLRVGRMRYRVVIVPEMTTIRRTTLELLRSFVEAGGWIVPTTEPPVMIDGEPSGPWETEFLAPDGGHVPDLIPAVLEGGGPAVSISGLRDKARRKTFVHVRDLPGGDRLVMLVNLHRTEGGIVDVRLRGKWRAVTSVDLDGGADRLLPAMSVEGDTRVRLPMEPTRVWLLRLSPDAVDVPAASATASGGAVTMLEPSGWQVGRLDENALPLDYAIWREGEGDWSARSLPVLSIQNRLNAAAYAGPLTLRYEARVDRLGADRSTKLVVEYPERYEIRVNGRKVSYADLPHWRDIRWSPIDVTGLLREGRNTIELHCPDFRHGDLRSYEDAAARYGTEVEAVYLVGDFSLRAAFEPRAADCPRWRRFGLPPVSQHCLAAGSVRVGEPAVLQPGDVTRQGLPFYAGRLRLSRTLSPSSRARRLRVGHLDAAVAEVVTDGQTVGHLVSQPYEVLLPPGARELSITLYGTLRNLLGPHHHPEGELPVVSPPLFEPEYDGPADEAVLAWARGEAEPARWVDGYWVVGFGDLGSISLEAGTSE